MNFSQRFNSLRRSITALFQVKWLRLTFQVIIVAICALFLFWNLNRSAAALQDVQVNPQFLLTAFLAALSALYLGAASWWLLLRSLRCEIDLLETLRNHLLSNLAKYVPGYGWQLLGKAYLTARQGIPAGTIGYAMIIELFLLIAVGILLTLVVFQERSSPWLTEYGISTALVGNLRLIASILIILLLIGFPFLSRLLRPDVQQRAIIYWMALITVSLGWLMLGVSFWLAGAALYPESASNISLYFFALAASVLIGLLVIFVPGGIGVRESIMVLLLSPAIPASLAVVIAAGSRFLYILADLIGIIPVEVLYRLRFKQKQIEQ